MYKQLLIFYIAPLSSGGVRSLSQCGTGIVWHSVAQCGTLWHSMAPAQCGTGLSLEHRDCRIVSYTHRCDFESIFHGITEERNMIDDGSRRDCTAIVHIRSTLEECVEVVQRKRALWVINNTMQ